MHPRSGNRTLPDRTHANAKRSVAIAVAVSLWAASALAQGVVSIPPNQPTNDLHVGGDLQVPVRLLGAPGAIAVYAVIEHSMGALRFTHTSQPPGVTVNEVVPGDVRIAAIFDDATPTQPIVVLHYMPLVAPTAWVRVAHFRIDERPGEVGTAFMNVEIKP